MDAVSRLERDLSTALVAVREWKNTFAHINRIPLDILSLIATHLASQKDLFRITFVCRHWRRTFLQLGALWSQLFLEHGEDYVTTLLERTKRSALEVVTNQRVPPGTVALLSPHAQQIINLKFMPNYWSDVLAFSEVNPGPFSLLRTLIMRIVKPPDSHGQSNSLAPLSIPLFSDAVNLEEFVLETYCTTLLEHFIFPNLTTFELSAPRINMISTLSLFRFLESSPALRTVEVRIIGGMIPKGIPREMVVNLPNVETFSLLVADNEWGVYETVAHISCPRAKCTSLMQQISDADLISGREIFPDSDSWQAIAYHYTTSPVEEVTFEMGRNQLATSITYSLIFQSSDATVITMYFEAFDADAEEEEGLVLHCGDINLEVFSQVCRSIRSHPLLFRIKRLHIKDKTGTLGTHHSPLMADMAGELFRSLPPLDKLTIHGCDLQTFLAPFTDVPEFGHFEKVFPPVKELTISVARMVNEQRCVDAVVELAKLQHELGTPFEHVTFLARGVPTAMVERMRQWISVVDCCEL